jgi:RNA polymerase-binding transcription factor DksA
LKEAEVTAVKKVAAPGLKKLVATQKAVPSAKTASPAPKKKSVPKKSTPAGKKSVPTTKKPAPKKTAPMAKKAAPAPKRTAPAAKRTAPAPKGPAPKKSAPAAKKAVGTSTKAAPPAAKAAAPVKKAPPAPKRPTVGPYAKEPKFLDEQRALLLEERGIYKGQAVDLRAEADSLALEREPGDVQFDEESGEGGTVTVDRERNLALSAQAGAAVEEIDDALRKIDRKMYGGCERCYQPIPKARLRALPFARLCVACKSGGLSRR